MSSRSSSSNRLPRCDNSSSSLEGMENAVHPRRLQERPPRIESIINLYADKPLPPTPGRWTPQPTPSPLSFVSNITPSSASTKSLQSDKSVSMTKSRTSKRTKKFRVPEQLQIRPKQPTRDSAKPESNVDSYFCNAAKHGLSSTDKMHPGTRLETPPPTREPIFSEWKAPKYRPSPRKANSAIPAVTRSKFENSWAEGYRSLIDDVSPQSPDASASVMTDPTFEPSPVTPPIPTWAEAGRMEARISNVLDQPEIPSLGTLDEEKQGREGAKSSTYSEIREAEDNFDSNWQPTRRIDLRLPQRRPSSKYPEVGLRPDSEVDTDKETRRESKGKRTSFHKGVSEAFDSIQHIANLNPFKHDPTQNEKEDPLPQTPRRKRASQRISLADHIPRSSPRPVEPKDKMADNGVLHADTRGRQLSLEFDRPRRVDSSLAQRTEKSVGKKLFSALEKGRLRRQQQDDWREGLKKQIVHVIPKVPVEGERF